MTDCRVLIILLFCSSVICQDCVTFDFERDFNSSFSNKIGVCGGVMDMWNIGNYENLPIDSPDTGSLKFVYPNEVLSCASSFTFEMTASGVLELNLFMNPTSDTDQVTILANQKVPSGQDAVVGNAWIIASDNNFVRGWRTVRLNISGFGTFYGYITILGMAARDSIVLIDSFRYISPSIEEEECVIYEKVTTTTTKTTQTDVFSTENETTQPSFTYTTVKTTITPEITTMIGNTTSEESDKTNTVSTTQSGNTDFTIPETDVVITTQKEDTQTTGMSFPTDKTVITESTFCTESSTETIVPITFTTPSTILTTKATTLQSTIESQTSTKSEVIEHDSTTQSEIISTGFTTKITNSDFTTNPGIIDQSTIFTTNSNKPTDFTVTNTPTNIDTTLSSGITYTTLSNGMETTTSVVTDASTETFHPITLTTLTINIPKPTAPITTVGPHTSTIIDSDSSTKSVTEESKQTTVTTSTESIIIDTTTNLSSIQTTTASGTTETKYTDGNIKSTTGMSAQTTTNQPDASSLSSDTSTSYTDTTTDVTQITIHPETTTIGQTESISTAEYISSGPTEQPESPTNTTEENTTEINTDNTTEKPPDMERYSFWNAFTITMVICLILIIIVVTAVVWYYIGKRSSPRESQIILPYFEELPRTLTIPRVSKVWTDSRRINRLSTIIKMK